MVFVLLWEYIRQKDSQHCFYTDFHVPDKPEDVQVMGKTENVHCYYGCKE
jgi:hypothetical protein